jgi:broad specificity phosphatase PhoE
MIQAEELAAELSAMLQGESVELRSSPKLRCIQTLKPLEHALGVTVKIDPLLTERGAEEPQTSVQSRVESFITSLRSAETSVVFCSHGDWIPEFFEILTGDARHLGKGEWTHCPGL